MNVKFSLFCLSRFLPISISACYYFHQSDAFATCKSDLQFPFAFWLIFWQVLLQIFAKNHTRNRKTMFQKFTKSKESQKAKKPKLLYVLVNLSFSADFCLVFCHWNPEKNWLGMQKKTLQNLGSLCFIFCFWQTFGKWFYSFLLGFQLSADFWCSVSVFLNSNFWKKLWGKIAKNQPKSKTEIGSLIYVGVANASDW